MSIARLKRDERGGGYMSEWVGGAAAVLLLSVAAGAATEHVRFRFVGEHAPPEVAVEGGLEKNAHAPGASSGNAVLSPEVQASCSGRFLRGAYEAARNAEGEVVGDLFGTTDAEVKRQLWERPAGEVLGDARRIVGDAAPRVVGAVPGLLGRAKDGVVATVANGQIMERGTQVARGALDIFLLDSVRALRSYGGDAYRGSGDLVAAWQSGDCIAFGRTARIAVNNAPEATLAIMDVFDAAGIGAGAVVVGKRFATSRRLVSAAHKVADAAHAAVRALPGPRRFAAAGHAACFTAGTEVHTPHGLTSIEEVALGDRVMTLGGAAAGATQVNPSWRRIELEMEDPRHVGGVLRIALLRSPSWLRAENATIGALVTIDLAEMRIRGEARVTSIGDAPRIERGRGRVVLSTIESQSSDVLVLKFRGSDESLEPTFSHPIYSLDRDGWVAAAKLRVGERLRSVRGEVVLASIARKPGTHTVYNIEVETDHTYLVGKLGVQTHNQCAAPLPPRGSGNGARNATRELLEAEHRDFNTFRRSLAAEVPRADEPTWRQVVLDYNRRAAPGDDYVRDPAERARVSLVTVLGDARFGKVVAPFVDVAGAVDVPAGQLAPRARTALGNLARALDDDLGWDRTATERPFLAHAGPSDPALLEGLREVSERGTEGFARTYGGSWDSGIDDAFDQAAAALGPEEARFRAGYESAKVRQLSTAEGESWAVRQQPSRLDVQLAHWHRTLASEMNAIDPDSVLLELSNPVVRRGLETLPVDEVYPFIRAYVPMRPRLSREDALEYAFRIRGMSDEGVESFRRAGAAAARDAVPEPRATAAAQRPARPRTIEEAAQMVVEDAMAWAEGSPTRGGILRTQRLLSNPALGQAINELSTEFADEGSVFLLHMRAMAHAGPEAAFAFAMEGQKLPFIRREILQSFHASARIVDNPNAASARRLAARAPDPPGGPVRLWEPKERQLAAAEGFMSRLAAAYTRGVRDDEVAKRLVDMRVLLKSRLLDRGLDGRRVATVAGHETALSLSPAQRARLLEEIAREAARQSVQPGAGSAAEILRRAARRLDPESERLFLEALVARTSAPTIPTQMARANELVREYTELLLHSDIVDPEVVGSVTLQHRLLTEYFTQSDATIKALGQLSELERALFFDAYAYEAARQIVLGRVVPNRVLEVASRQVDLANREMVEDAFGLRNGAAARPTPPLTVTPRYVADAYWSSPSFWHSLADAVAKRVPILGHTLGLMFDKDVHIQNEIVALQHRRVDQLYVDVRRTEGVALAHLEDAVTDASAERARATIIQSALQIERLQEANVLLWSAPVQAGLWELSRADRILFLDRYADLMQAHRVGPGGFEGLFATVNQFDSKRAAAFYKAYERAMLRDASAWSWRDRVFDAALDIPLVGPLVERIAGESVVLARDLKRVDALMDRHAERFITSWELPAFVNRLVPPPERDTSTNQVIRSSVAPQRRLAGRPEFAAAHGGLSHDERIPVLRKFVEVTIQGLGAPARDAALALLESGADLTARRRALFYERYEDVILEQLAAQRQLTVPYMPARPWFAP